MKKLIVILSIAFCGIAAVSFASSNGTTEIKNDKTTKTEVVVETESNEKALYCSVTSAGGAVVDCWFCDCGALYKAVQNA